MSFYDVASPKHLSATPLRVIQLAACLIGDSKSSRPICRNISARTHSAHNLGTIVRWINVDPKRSFSEWRVHNVDDIPRHGQRVCVIRLKRPQPVKRL